MRSVNTALPAAVLVALLLVTFGCDEDGAIGDAEAVARRDGGSDDSGKGSSAARARRAPRLPGMECLVNEFGIRRKVIVAQRGVRCVNHVPGGSPTGPALKFFQAYFVFDVYPREGQPAFFRIGSTPRTDSIIGWAQAHQCVPWDTRVGARYRRSGEHRVPPLLVYSKKEHLVDLVTKGETKAQPVARAAFDSGHTFMPWPIAETDQFTADGRIYELVRLNFLGEFKAGTDLASPEAGGGPRYSDDEIRRVKSGVKQLDIVFAVDNTHSTTPFVAAIRDAVSDISRRLHDMPFKPDVAFGLVLYRDYVKGLMFTEGGQESVTRRFPLQNDLGAFLKTVEPLRAPDKSSEEWSEAVYDGIHVATKRTNWRGEGLSARVVVLIGDNSAHEPGSKKNPRNLSADAVVREARDRNVKIFSLCINGGGGKEEQAQHWGQFERLARGTGGHCYALEDAGKVVEQVRQIMETETAVVHTRSVVVEAFSEGKTKDQIVAETNIDIRALTEVMEFLGGAGIDPERLGPGVPTFATGWCLVEVQGMPILEREVYVARAELDLLLAELNTLCVQLSPEMAKGVFRTGLGGRVNPMSFFAEHRPEPMDVFLMAKGVPCGQGVLKLTRADIEHMSEDRRAVLRERIARQIVPQLTNARNDDRYYAYLDDLEFGWVREALLP